MITGPTAAVHNRYIHHPGYMSEKEMISCQGIHTLLATMDNLILPLYNNVKR